MSTLLKDLKNLFYFAFDHIHVGYNYVEYKYYNFEK